MLDDQIGQLAKENDEDLGDILALIPERNRQRFATRNPFHEAWEKAVEAAERSRDKLRQLQQMLHEGSA